MANQDRRLNEEAWKGLEEAALSMPRARFCRTQLCSVSVRGEALAPDSEMKMTTDLTARYSGKPMLRLLDAYVLDALGALDDRTAQSMAEMAPKTIAALNVPASTWQQAVELSMEMPPSSVAELRAKWEQYVHEALAAGVTPDVLAWTHKMVDVRSGIE